MCLREWASRTDVLFIGHFDTVYPQGTAEVAPFRIEGDKAYGAGILDMKAGLVLMTEVARCMAETGKKAQFDVVFQL